MSLSCSRALYRITEELQTNVNPKSSDIIILKMFQSNDLDVELLTYDQSKKLYAIHILGEHRVILKRFIFESEVYALWILTRFNERGGGGG